MINQAAHLRANQFEDPEDQRNAKGGDKEKQSYPWLDLYIVLLKNFEANEGHLHAVVSLAKLHFRRLRLKRQQVLLNEIRALFVRRAYHSILLELLNQIWDVLERVLHVLGSSYLNLSFVMLSFLTVLLGSGFHILWAMGLPWLVVRTQQIDSNRVDWYESSAGVRLGLICQVSISCIGLRLSARVDSYSLGNCIYNLVKILRRDLLW